MTLAANGIAGPEPVATTLCCYSVALTMIPTQSFETLVFRLFWDNPGAPPTDRRHGIASAHAICPSKPSVFAMSR
jgi:hypothetical protein